MPTLYIYSWDFELLEQVEMPHPVKIWTDDMLCGETEDRLILAAQLFEFRSITSRSPTLAQEMWKYIRTSCPTWT